MTKPMIFHLEGPYYKAILDGAKRVEYRDNTPYWRKRLLGLLPSIPIWFVWGYPQRNLPRIEATIHSVELNLNTNQIEVHFRDATQKV
jgi:hypothetical protein